MNLQKYTVAIYGGNLCYTILNDTSVETECVTTQKATDRVDHNLIARYIKT